MEGIEGLQGELLRAIQALYDDGMSYVKVDQSKVEMFNVCKGVRKGCTLFP